MHPAEQASVIKAVDKRRREFATVRHCARRALAVLGLPPVPLLRGERGAPQWPPGVVGSLTHCDGYRAAAVARSSDLHSLGIDAEPHDALPDGVLPMIALPDEMAMLTRLSELNDKLCWDRLLFSAKESVYKTWFPIARRWLDFQEASVMLEPDGTLQAQLHVAGPLVDGKPISTFTGRWLVSNGLVITAITVG
jgi:4'-phosphopantetheinyl transferase EntD